jgi:hypothetical protein
LPQDVLATTEWFGYWKLMKAKALPMPYNILPIRLRITADILPNSPRPCGLQVKKGGATPVFPSVLSWKLSTNCGKDALLLGGIFKKINRPKPLSMLYHSPHIPPKPLPGLHFAKYNPNTTT